jgi:hypothetical protein
MNSQKPLSSSIGLLCLVSACSGEALVQGAEQPIRVQSAQYFTGRLPGTKPLSADEVTAGKKPKTPNVTSLTLGTRVFDGAATGRPLSGRASIDAFAVALQLEGEGDGYWVVPVSSPDPLNNNEFSWALRFDLSPELPAGRHHIVLAATDEDGKAGTQSSSEICVRSEIPDNLNACTPTRQPPALVISLGWGTPSDIDLRVKLPSGEVIDRNLPEAHGGRFAGDGNAGCQLGLRARENVIWDADAPRGTYSIQARLFKPCGNESTDVVAGVYGVRKGSKSGTFRQVKLLEKHAVISTREPAAGSELGLFVTEFTLE